MSAAAIVRYKRVRYIEVSLWEFDRDSAGSTKNFPLLQGVGYIAYPLLTGLTVIIIILTSSVNYFSCHVELLVRFEVKSFLLTMERDSWDIRFTVFV